MKVDAGVIPHLAAGQTVDREVVGGKDRGKVRLTTFWFACRGRLAPWGAGAELHKGPDSVLRLKTGRSKTCLCGPFRRVNPLKRADLEPDGASSRLTRAVRVAAPRPSPPSTA